MKTVKSAIALALIGLASTANAQLEEMVVTAQKVEASLQDTPVAVTAFSSSNLEAIGAFNATDVGKLAPNVSIQPTFGSAGNIRTNIRGIATGDPSLAVDPKVGMYLDGVYIARNAGAVFDIVDMERIEILRGPQGTLWGKNTTGGAVGLITKKPSGEWGFKEALTGGEDGLFRSVSTLNTKKAAGVSATLSYMNKQYDGWAENHNPVSQQDLGSEDTNAYRVALRWEPTGSLVADYTYDYTKTKAVPVPLQITFMGPGATDPGIIGSFNTQTGKFYGGYNPLRNMLSIVEDDKRVEDFYLDDAAKETTEVYGHNLTLDWDVTESLEIKSITGYRNYESDYPGSDLDGGSWQTAAGESVPMFHAKDNKEQDQFSQEFQFIGHALDEKIDYVAGLFYFEEQGKELNPWDAMFYVPTRPVLLKGIGPTLGSWYKTDNQSAAAYSQVKYHFNESWDVAVGVRYTDDHKKITLLDDDPRFSTDHVADHGWSKTTYDLIVSYMMNDDISFYAKRVEGYNAGVYSLGAINHSDYTDFEQFDIPADPEEVDSYEVGMKAEWLDNRLRTNVAVFYNDNQNLQVTEFINGVRGIRNSGGNHTEGAELEFNALLTDNLSINGGYGYHKTDFEEGGPQAEGKNSGSLSVVYSHPMDWGSIDARFDTTYIDDQEFSSSLYGNAESYTLMNARLGVAGIELGDAGTVRAAVWGKNLGDKEYKVYGADFGTDQGFGYAGNSFGTPRSFGLDVIYEY